MQDETIWQGATYESTIKDTDLTAETAVLTLKEVTTGEIMPVDPVTLEEQEINGKTYMVGTFYVDMDIVGEFTELYTVTYSNGTTGKFPEPKGNCEDGECDLPTITVCEASDEETS